MEIYPNITPYMNIPQEMLTIKKPLSEHDQARRLLKVAREEGLRGLIRDHKEECPSQKSISCH